MINYLFGNLSPDVVAISIPILMVLGGTVIAVVAILMHARKKELVHKERLTAMEKGIEIPTEPIETKEKRPAYVGNRNSGLVMVFIGITSTIAMKVAGDWVAGVWGLIPLGIGVALLIGSIIEQREVQARKGPGPQ